MNGISLNSYLHKVSRAWNDYDGETLAEMLSFGDSHIASSKLQIEEPEGAVEAVIESPLDEMVSCHLRGCWAIANSDFEEAYQTQEYLVSCFAKFLGTCKDENWALPMMQVVCTDLRKFALKVDKQKATTGGDGKPNQTLEKASEGIMACFRVCTADARAAEGVSKRWGMLHLVNQLFKIYLRSNKLNLCKPLIRTIESSAFKDRFKKSQLVTYRYYVGRKYMFDNNFKEAEEYLRYAFEKCDMKKFKNKRMILIYLIPVKMLLGQMPKESLLTKYNLPQFKGIVEAVKEGNVKKLNIELEEKEKIFIHWGIFLILEKLKVTAYRNLFKTVALLSPNHLVNIESFTRALRFMEVEDIDNEETACIIANLIFEGRIKGYISAQHQKLVLSKVQPFPPLQTSLA